MAKLKIFGYLLPALLLLPISALADRVEGRLNGLDCASKGEVCPTDKDDPHVILERDFVVQTEDGNYFFITNMDWRTKLQFVLQMVRVEGQLSDRLSAISADEFWVKQDGEYQLEWSLMKARAEQKRQQKSSYVPISND